jgi:long-chain fatty acid transport protein
MRRLALLTALTALCASFAGAAAAAVPDQFGFGSRSTALGGAVTADARDFSAGYYNPAGIVEAPDVELSVGYMYNLQALAVDDLDNGVEDVHGVVVGLIAPGELFGVPFAFSVGAHLPDDGLSHVQARRQGVPRWELYDARTQLIYIEACLAVRPLPWLEVGGGIGYLTATSVHFGIRGRADLLSPYDSQLEHEVDGDLTAVRYPQAGLRLLWDGWGALGVTYRGESNLDLEVDALLQGVVDFAGIEVPLLYELEAATISSFTPHQLAVGLSFQRVADLSLNFDLTWMHWSAYASPVAELFARLQAEPPPGTPVELPDSPLPTVPIPPELEDRFVPRFGVEYRGVRFGAERELDGNDVALVELPLRLGYWYEASPVPDQGGETNLIDADRHTWTAGLGLGLNRPFGDVLDGSLRLHVHGLFSWLPERTVEKTSAADFVGDYRADGMIVGVGSNVEASF